MLRGLIARCWHGPIGIPFTRAQVLQTVLGGISAAAVAALAAVARSLPTNLKAPLLVSRLFLFRIQKMALKGFLMFI